MVAGFGLFEEFVLVVVFLEEFLDGFFVRVGAEMKGEGIQNSEIWSKKTTQIFEFPAKIQHSNPPKKYQVLISHVLVIVK